MSLLQKGINRDALKMRWRRAGRQPVSVNSDRVAGLATASVNTLTEAGSLRQPPRLIGRSTPAVLESQLLQGKSFGKD